MVKKYNVIWEIGSLVYCCGVQEAGNFTEETEDEHDSGYDWYDSLREAWIEALEEMRQSPRPERRYPIIFNFVKYSGAKTFEANELRQLVLEQEDQLFVHSWINPGSGNLIEQYMLTNGSTKKK